MSDLMDDMNHYRLVAAFKPNADDFLPNSTGGCERGVEDDGGASERNWLEDRSGQIERQWNGTKPCHAERTWWCQDR